MKTDLYYKIMIQTLNVKIIIDFKIAIQSIERYSYYSYYYIILHILYACFLDELSAGQFAVSPASTYYHQWGIILYCAKLSARLNWHHCLIVSM
jgi:hypothetical protein